MGGVPEKLLTLFFGQVSHTHTHTRSCNSRAHNTEIPQPGCACVRIVYSFWNIMLSILSNDMHSTRAGAAGGGQGGQGLLLGLDRHFSYWQCLIQSVVCLSISLSLGPWPISIVSSACFRQPSSTSAAVAAAIAAIPFENQSANGQKGATFSCGPSIFWLFFLVGLQKRLRLRLIS